jgi:trehalose utilization protein
VLQVTVWGEGRHEQTEPEVARRYPGGMHRAVADAICEHLGESAVVRTAVLDQPQHGLPDDVLEATDVLTWWGHTAHSEVDDGLVDRVHERVLAGMGLVVLQSGHHSKIFRRLMGTTCNLRWRNAGDRELVWTVNPGHPIAVGVPSPIVLEQQEMYGEFFDIPTPDELVFVSSFSGGEVFRSGCTFRRGHGKVLQPRRPGLPRLPPPGRSPSSRQLGRLERAARSTAGAGLGRPRRDRLVREGGSIVRHARAGGGMNSSWHR